MKAWEGLEMTNADWWADLRPQRVWTLHKGEHAAAIDFEAVSGIGGRSCSLWTESGARPGCSARMSRPNWSAQSRTHGLCSRGRGGRDGGNDAGRTCGTSSSDQAEPLALPAVRL
jgi:hypothetical protein